jgi:hypothetical protein
MEALLRKFSPPSIAVHSSGRPPVVHKLPPELLAHITTLVPLCQYAALDCT